MGRTDVYGGGGSERCMERGVRKERYDGGSE